MVAISSGSPTISSLFSSRLIFTMSKAELRSKLAIAVYIFESRALAISDCISRPAVLVLLNLKNQIRLSDTTKYNVLLY